MGMCRSGELSQINPQRDRHTPSFLHGIDPRVKLIVSILFIILMTSMNSLHLALIGGAFMGGLLAMARIPLASVLKRLLWVVPFACMLVLFLPFMREGTPIYSIHVFNLTFTATRQGLMDAFLLLTRAVAAILTVILLTLTTDLNQLLMSMEALYVPRIFTSLIEFIIRYFYVLGNEWRRIINARKSRGFDEKESIFKVNALRNFGQMLGNLFLRSYQRSERVHLAMMARGFNGLTKRNYNFRMQSTDYYWAIGVMAVGICLTILDKGGTLWFR